MLPEQFTNRMKEMLKEEYEDFAACYGNDHAHSLRISHPEPCTSWFCERSVHLKSVE